MTRRLVALLGAALLVGSVAVAPDPLAKAALPPMPVVAANPISFDLRLGDGIFRVRIRGGESDTSLTIEVRMPAFFEVTDTPPRQWTHFTDSPTFACRGVRGSKPLD